MGIILVQPTAPMPLYGVVATQARGHVVTAILIAMVAMLFTAVSYGRMAAAYPSAGSAYTYVGQEIHPSLGFLTGWSMLMDYVLNPLICVIWCSKAMLNFVPEVPELGWQVFFAVVFTWLNLRGIQTTARTNTILAVVMGGVVFWMLVATIRYVAGDPSISYTKPFYDPDTFSFAKLSSASSLAVLTYIGFDGISTLSEEVKNPRRNILLGSVFTCLVIGILSAIEVYAGQLVWPSNVGFPDIDTAYVHIAGKAGGALLFQAVNLTLIVASIGSGSGGMLAGARLLYGMGRDSALPKSFFGYLHPKRHIPSRNVILIGLLCFTGARLLSYERGAELLNFGAFIGFMGVNLSCFLRYWLRSTNRKALDFVLPLAGFTVCAFLWWNLSVASKLLGTAWLIFGLIYGAITTKGFRDRLVRFEVPVDNEHAS